MTGESGIGAACDFPCPSNWGRVVMIRCLGCQLQSTHHFVPYKGMYDEIYSDRAETIGAEEFMGFLDHGVILYSIRPS